MTDKKHKVTEEIETTLACTAFAEEGAPCPLCDEKGKDTKPAQTSPIKTESILDSVEDDFACTAFSDQNEKCPIDHAKRK